MSFRAFDLVVASLVFYLSHASHPCVQQAVARLSLADNKPSTRMFVDSFSGPNFVTDAHDGGVLQLTQKSVGIFVFLESGMDISTLKHKVVIVPKKHAKIFVEVKQHLNMLDPFLLTPVESAGCEEFVNCVRAYLQERQRKGGHIIKAEATINGDFEEGLVQPIMQAPGGPCRYKAMPSNLSPFRISNVGGTSPNHSQGVVLTTLLLCKLHRDTINALRTPEYAMPMMMARSPGFASPPPHNSSFTGSASYHHHSAGNSRYSGSMAAGDQYSDPHSDGRQFEGPPNPSPGVASFAGETPQTPGRRPGNLKDDRRYSAVSSGRGSAVNAANRTMVSTVVEDTDMAEEEGERKITPVKRVRQSM